MDFENQTPFSADVWRTQLFYKDLLMAIVVLKATFKVSPDGSVSSDKEDQIPLQEGPQETPLGLIEGDYAPIKEYADVVILGKAYAPDGEPVPKMTLQVQIGQLRNSLLVFGNRYWTKEGSFTEPEPFITMPVTYTNAYGGTAREYNNIQGNFAANPIGKGYVVLEEDLDGTSLPNIEDPEEPIRTWKDRPTPAGFAPLPAFSSLRGLRGVKVDTEKKMTTLEPLFFNYAHPKMMLPEIPLKAKGTLRGMTKEGIWEFEIPELYIGAEVYLGEKRSCFVMRPDTLCLLPEEKRFFILYRQAFIYPFIPEQKRRICLTNLDNTTALEMGKENTFKSLRKAAEDPKSLIRLEPLMKNSQALPLSYDKVMEYYPLTEIIHSLPVCEPDLSRR